MKAATITGRPVLDCMQVPAAVCPACHERGLTSFYSLPGAPLQSNLLLRTRDEAIAMPVGDLDLAFCNACGFVTNLAFDPASQELSAQYEASQGFSGTFNSFTKSLAVTWNERYHLAGRTAIEIGCGKGEFLATLCRGAGCRGIGFDPTLDPARLPDTQGLDIEWVADRFDERAADRGMDFICCRHTLEHIPDVGAFIGMLRAAIGSRDSVRVGFEVPDTLRVLTEGAFWDIYYEHCSYFTPGSLARLFALSGFTVLDIRREFDGQYIVLEGAPAGLGAVRTSPPSVANDLPEVAAAVAGFAGRCGAAIDRWREGVEAAIAGGRRVVLWGASSKAVGFLTTLGLTYEKVAAVVDINPHKQGTFLPTSGSKIVSPDDLRDIRPDVVIAMNPIYLDEIGRDLKDRGISAELLPL